AGADPGRAQAGRLDLVLGGQLTDAVGDDVLGLGRVVGRGVASQPGQDAAVAVPHPGGYFGPADVHADGQPHGLALLRGGVVLILRPRPEGGAMRNGDAVLAEGLGWRSL